MKKYTNTHSIQCLLFVFAQFLFPIQTIIYLFNTTAFHIYEHYNIAHFMEYGLWLVTQSSFDSYTPQIRVVLTLTVVIIAAAAVFGYCFFIFFSVLSFGAQNFDGCLRIHDKSHDANVIRSFESIHLNMVRFYKLYAYICVYLCTFICILCLLSLDSCILYHMSL